MGCSENDSSPVNRRSNQRGGEGWAIRHNSVSSGVHAEFKAKNA